ncbi:MAG: CRISPR-associated helicase Cas3' [Verrucomicrobiae bacterium]|nr:CRISPR-associated helicase Cas3' [Verrucomicrobiae bacterium]
MKEQERISNGKSEVDQLKSEISWQDCWAKTDDHQQPALGVLEHCLNVGYVARALEESMPDARRILLTKGLVTLAAVHDVGKLSAGFQSKCNAWLASLNLGATEKREWLKANGNHAAVTQAILGYSAFSGNRNVAAWAIAAGGHHGFFPCPSRGIYRLTNDFVSERFEKARAEVLALLIAEFGPVPEIAPLDVNHILWATGFITMADWLGSNTDVFPLHSVGDSENGMRAVAALNLGKGRACAAGFQDLFPFPPNRLQEILLNAATAPGLYIVEAPMGEGKTEAALAVAHQLWAAGHHHGLYFGLPTQLTSERIHYRLAQFLENAIDDEGARLTLVHGNAWLRDDMRILDIGQASPKPESNDLIDARQWFTSSRRPLLAAFGAGTVDQALMATMPLKHAGLRLFALSGKVIVLDEVHSFDPYTSELIDSLIERLLHLRCSVIVLSATLTLKRREQMLARATTFVPQLASDYPLVTTVINGAVGEIPFEASAEHQRTVVIDQRNPSPAVWNEIADAAIDGACVLVVRNTVALAQETYKILKSACIDGIEVGLLHSRYTITDREAIESKWLERFGKEATARGGCILVSTQIVEQSVDIDADLLVTDLAPTDLLIQRLGRLHRHRKNDENRPHVHQQARVIILDPLTGNESTAREISDALSPHCFIYPPYVLVKASAWWRGNTRLSLPGDIRPFIEGSYSSEADKGEWEELKESLERLTKDQFGTAKARNNPLVDISGFDSENNTKFGTRWKSQPTALLVLARKLPKLRSDKLELINGETIDVSSPVWSLAVAKALYRNAVKLPRWQINPALSDVPEWLALHMHEATIAVVEHGQLQFLTDNPMPGTLTYDHRGAAFEKSDSTTTSVCFEPFEEDGWF